MTATAIAGVLYAAVVFAAGFVLGTLRVLVLAPAMGETAAVLIELPVILAISWIVCQWVVGKFAVPAIPVHRIIMGVVALAALLGAEAVLSTTLFGRTFVEFLATFRAPAGAAGLAGQVVFALFPVLQLRR